MGGRQGCAPLHNLMTQGITVPSLNDAAADKRLNWDDARWFLAVARARSAHRAAAEMGVSHTTVGRRIGQLEASLGVELFARRGNALTLTNAGTVALARAIRMESAAAAFKNDITSSSNRLQGEVKINSSEGLGTFWLTPGLQGFFARNPGLVPNWITTNTKLPKYLYRDAVSVPWWRPEHPSVVARKLGEVRYSLYVGPSYEERFGLPRSEDDLAAHNVLQFNGYEINPSFAAWNALLGRFPPTIRMESAAAAVPAMMSGNFLSLLPDYVSYIAPALQRVDVDFAIRTELWVAYHEDNRKSAAITSVAAEVVKLAQHSRGTWLSR